MLIYTSALVAAVGLVVYVVAVNPKAQELGRIAFFAGLLVFLLQWAPRIVR